MENSQLEDSLLEANKSIAMLKLNIEGRSVDLSASEAVHNKLENFINGFNITEIKALKR